MKRKIFITLIVALVLSLTLVALIACNNPVGNGGFTVTFVVDGRTFATRKCDKNATTVQEEPIVPEKYGYTAAWEPYTLNGKNLTVNAIYTPKQYTVVFNYNGADGSYQTYTTVTFDKAVGALPQPTKTDNYFAGWDYLGTKITAESIWQYDIEEPIVFNATWLPSSQAITYTLNKSTMTATIKSVYSYMTEVIVPQTYNGYTVTAIGDGAFAYCRSLTNVTISSTVRSVGERVFAGCNVLQSVTVDTNNQYLYSEGNCIITKSAKMLVAGTINSAIPSGVTSIGSGAFKGVEIRSINLPNSVKSIGEEAFYSATSLTRVTIPSSVTSLGEKAFYDCTKLQTVNFAEGSQLKTISASAFYNCKALQQITIPDSVETIGANAFAECYVLTTVNLGTDSNLHTIGGSAFSYCYDLETINLPSKLEVIGDYAFYHCDELTDVTFAATIRYIGSYAFSFGGLKNIYYLGTMENWCKIEFDILENPMGKAEHFYVKNQNGEWEIISKIELPDTITTINGYQFTNFGKMETLTIPKSVTKIGNYAFGGCTFTNVYYDGTLEDWQKIEFGLGDTPQQLATNFYVRDNDGNWVLVE